MSTTPQDISSTSQHHNDKSTAALSPTASSPGRSFLLPSPLITKRTRTRSMCELALERPIERGKIHYFCRVKGHGFIKPDNGDSDIFVHVSDIDGEYVPLVGDEVTYRLVPVPPKNEKFQAVHVQITNYTPQVHQRWESPLTKDEEHEGSRPSSPHKME